MDLNLASQTTMAPPVAPPVKENEVLITGGEIDGSCSLLTRPFPTNYVPIHTGIVMALIQAANDNNTEVLASIMASLRTLGKVRPALVLSSCEVFLQKHPKV